MTSVFKKARWSPYWVGVAIGVLSWITFAFMGKALGVSTTFVRAVGTVEKMVAPEYVADTGYLVKYLGNPEKPKPVFEWQFALVVMLPFGAFAAARISRTRFEETVPNLWAWRYGASKRVRYGAAFLGGVIIMFGARLAGGCTSGHGISGGLQLALSSWIFFMSLFAGGIATAFLLYGKNGGDHV